MLVPFGTSLAVQWLRLHAFTAGDTDLILGWGTLISPAARPIHIHTHTHTHTLTHTQVFSQFKCWLWHKWIQQILCFPWYLPRERLHYPFGESPSKEYTWKHAAGSITALLLHLLADPSKRSDPVFVSPAGTAHTEIRVYDSTMWVVWFSWSFLPTQGFLMKP